MRKALLIACLAAVALVQTVLYLGVHSYYRGKEDGAGPAERIRRLERAAGFDPWNDKIAFELGRAYFDEGVELLGEPVRRDAAFTSALRSFLKSIRLDPVSAAAHFHLAQALQYMGYLGLPSPTPSFDEYKKAAALTGHNSQIYYEVGRVLLSRWESLKPEEKEFTLEILRETLASKDPEKLVALLEVWNLHGQDYAVVDRILPRDPEAYRTYAQFLGQKSLSVEARQKALAEAEALEFAKARTGSEQAQRAFDDFLYDDASAKLSACLKTLKSIQFYQNLTHEELIDPREFKSVLKSVYLLLAECQMDATRSLADPDGYASAYLGLEDEPMAVADFEKFMRERGMLGDVDADPKPSSDLQALAFRLGLDFKQNRYKDITRAGGLFQVSTLMVSEAGKPYYVRIMQLIGDSFLKLDYIYEAERYYSKALEAGPGNLASLLRLEKCYARLNNTREAEQVRAEIQGVLTPPNFDLTGRTVIKGETLPIAFVCEDRRSEFRIEFVDGQLGRPPLVTVLFNGRVVWEDYAGEGRLAFQVTPQAGSNILEIGSVNHSLSLLRAVITPVIGEQQGE
jgi:tetratricopeptide (TPR) repeat protein